MLTKNSSSLAKQGNRSRSRPLISKRKAKISDLEVCLSNRNQNPTKEQCDKYYFQNSIGAQSREAVVVFNNKFYDPEMMKLFNAMQENKMKQKSDKVKDATKKLSSENMDSRDIFMSLESRMGCVVRITVSKFQTQYQVQMENLEKIKREKERQMVGCC